jgi:repressor LexA
MFDASKIVLSDTDSCEKALANENGEVTRAVLTAYRIRKTRLSANMPQKDLAEKIGVRKQTLHKYENAIITNIPSDKIEAIAHFLDISPAYLMGWTAEPNPDRVKNLIDITSIKRKKYPLLGAIACGDPLVTDESDAFEFDDIGADFALRCVGDSMTGARIYDGDLVFIRQCSLEDIRNGEIAAVRIDHYGDCTLKKVYYDSDRQRLTLMPCNPDFEPIILEGSDLDADEFKVIGKAVAFVANL